MTADGGKHLGAVIPGRVYYIREKVSGNYLDVKGGEANNAVTAQLIHLMEVLRRNGS